MKRFFVGLVFLCLFSSLSALQPFKIKSIEFRGLSFLPRATAQNYLPIKVGQTMTDVLADQTIQSLYNSHLFQQVSLSYKAGRVIITVKERAVISKVKISGEDELKESDIERILQKIGIVVGQPLQPSKLKLAKTVIQKNYLSMGFYGAEVEVSQQKLSDQRTQVNINITEGSIAGIKSISIGGNQRFTDEELRKGFQMKTTRIWSVLFHDDRFSQQKLQADLETLRSFYYDRGYLDFKVTSSQVSLTPDESGVYVSIHIREGKQYHVARVQMIGGAKRYRKSLTRMITLKPGEVFSRARLMRNVDVMRAFLSSRGYAFAQVRVNTQLNRRKQLIFVKLTVKPGRRVYVRRIRFVGNNLTKDSVLRREMRQYEGGIFDSKNIDESKRRLKNLGYLSEVNMKMTPVPGRKDQVDLDFSVKERSTASINLSLGYSSAYHETYGINWKQPNVLGSGNNFSIALEKSRYNSVANLDFFDPYFTTSGISQNVGVKFQKTSPGRVNLSDYRQDNLAFYLGYGFPVSAYQTVSAGFEAQHLAIHANSTSPREITRFLNKYGDDFKIFRLNLNWSYSRLDQAIFPTNGSEIGTGVSISNSFSGNALHYFKSYAHSSWYHPLFRGLVLHARGGLMYGSGFSSTTELPPYENYTMGGLGSVAGYEANGLGPKDSNGRSLGGSVGANASVSVLSSLPFSEDARAAVFVDAGNVFKNHLDLGQMRYSVGVGLLWNVAGQIPLQFALAKAINPSSTDDTQDFEFTIGSSF